MKRFRAAGHAGPRDAGRLLFGNVTEIHDLTVTELAAAIRAGQLSPVEITEHYLQRIERLNEQVGAFYTVTPELARERRPPPRRPSPASCAAMAPGCPRCPR